MKKEFCDDFYDECSGDLDLSSNYCDIHAEQDVDGNDQYYSYPYTESGEQQGGKRRTGVGTSHYGLPSVNAIDHD